MKAVRERRVRRRRVRRMARTTCAIVWGAVVGGRLWIVGGVHWEEGIAGDGALLVRDVGEITLSLERRR